mmetsp:Transcript_71714/g.154823  ORF Transcript_71714/g.154823 Transcript_71714/m.154823 type:complete len:235 (-) Transcript_71714:1392-2096(-)
MGGSCRQPRRAPPEDGRVLEGLDLRREEVRGRRGRLLHRHGRVPRVADGPLLRGTDPGPHLPAHRQLRRARRERRRRARPARGHGGREGLPRGRGRVGVLLHGLPLRGSEDAFEVARGAGRAGHLRCRHPRDHEVPAFLWLHPGRDRPGPARDAVHRLGRPERAPPRVRGLHQGPEVVRADRRARGEDAADPRGRLRHEVQHHPLLPQPPPGEAEGRPLGLRLHHRGVRRPLHQ